MNEQEQAIAKIQQTLDYCIQQTLRSLEDTIERKAEVLPVNDLAKVERASTPIPWMNSQPFIPSSLLFVASRTTCTFPTIFGKAHSLSL